MQPPLIHDGDKDYTLPPTETSVWITVDNISIYILRTPNGTVDVRLCPKGYEAEPANDLAQAQAFQTDAIDFHATFSKT